MTPPVVSKVTSLVANLLGQEEGDGAEALYLKTAIALSAARRDRVFEDLTQSLCELLEADGALIGVHDRAALGDRVKVLALYLDGRWVEDFEYPVNGTPCADVLGKEFCYFETGVTGRCTDAAFARLGIEGYAGIPLLNADGQSLGLIAVMSHGLLKARGRVEALLRLFSDRVLMEIERARTEDALKSSEELYGAVFNWALDGIAMLTLEHEIVDINPALEKMSGYRREDVVGRKVMDLWPGNQVLSNFFADVVKHGSACAEGPVARRDGQLGVREFRGTLVQFGGRTHILEIVRDISERQRAEEQRAALESQLRHAQRMEVIGQLTGGIAHDFNNILTGLLGYVEMAGERAAELQDERLSRYLDRAGRAGARARELVQQMLTFSRGKRGTPRAVDVGLLTRNLLSLLESTLPSSIEVEPLIPEQLPTTTIDPLHLEQVLMNLCINARDAMEGTGRLRIELSEHRFSDCFCCASCKQAIDGNFVALSIIDTGPGIAPDVLQRMFEPFFSTKEVGKGTGMGLSIVHGIVHDYGGHLVVRTAPGEGTTITVLLPVDADRGDAPAADKAGRGSPGASAPLGARVLLVDDDGDVLEYMRELLESWGCQVTAFRDAPAAREHFASHRDEFTLALLDQTMPQLTGLELAKSLRATRPALPVVLYTGYSDTLNEEVVREAGVAALVKKPIDRRSLRRVLESLLQLPASADTND